MFDSYIGIIIIGILVILIAFFGFKATVNKIITLVCNLFVGLLLVWLINHFAIFGLNIPLNLITVLAIGIFGGAGVVLIAILMLLGIL